MVKLTKADNWIVVAVSLWCRIPAHVATRLTAKINLPTVRCHRPVNETAYHGIRPLGTVRLLPFFEIPGEREVGLPTLPDEGAQPDTSPALQTVPLAVDKPLASGWDAKFVTALKAA